MGFNAGSGSFLFHYSGWTRNIVSEFLMYTRYMHSYFYLFYRAYTL